MYFLTVGTESHWQITSHILWDTLSTCLYQILPKLLVPTLETYWSFYPPALSISAGSQIALITRKMWLACGIIPFYILGALINPYFRPTTFESNCYGNLLKVSLLFSFTRTFRKGKFAMYRFKVSEPFTVEQGSCWEKHHEKWIVINVSSRFLNNT